MKSCLSFLAFLSLIGQIMSYVIRSPKNSFINQAINEFHIVSDSCVVIRVGPKVTKLFMARKPPSQYGELGVFVSNLLKGGIKSNYSSSIEFGGHIGDEFFDYISREAESSRIVDLFNKRQNLRRERPNAKRNKQRNPLIALPGAPGSGKTTFLVHFPESKAYQGYIQSNHTVLVSTLSFNSAMDGGGPAFGLRLLYGFLKAMGLLPMEIEWTDFFYEYESFKDISALEVIQLIESLVDSPASKLEFLVLVDELSKMASLARIAKMPNANDILINTMAEINALLSTYANVNVVVSSLSPQFIEELITQTSKRRIDYVIPRPLIGSSLGASACEYITDYLIDSMNGTKYCPDPTNVKIMKNLYLLLSGHPRSLEYMSKSMMDDPKNWCSLKQEMCKDNKHSSFLMTALEVLDRYVTAVPKISLDDYTTISKYIFAAERTTATEESSRMLLESGYLQIYEANNNDFILMSPSFVALRWMYGSHKLPIDPIKYNKLYQIQKLTENFSDLRLSYMMEYIIAITILSHSYERNKIDSILGESSSYNPLGKALNFKVQYEENITNTENLILPNHIYMAKVNQQGYDMRVVAKDDKSDIPLYCYLQVKIRLSTTEALVKVTAKMIHYNLKHYQSICPKHDFQSLYMYLYIWDTVTKEMIRQEDLVDELVSLGYKDIEDTIKFINDYYDNLIIMNKSDLKKLILPSLVAIPDFLQEVNGQTTGTPAII